MNVRRRRITRFSDTGPVSQEREKWTMKGVEDFSSKLMHHTLEPHITNNSMGQHTRALNFGPGSCCGAKYRSSGWK